MGLEVYLLVLDSDFFTDVVAVKKDRIFRQAQQGGDFFIGFPFFHQVGDPNLGRCQIDVTRGKLTDEWGDDVVQIRFRGFRRTIPSARAVDCCIKKRRQYPELQPSGSPY